MSKYGKEISKIALIHTKTQSGGIFGGTFIFYLETKLTIQPFTSHDVDVTPTKIENHPEILQHP